MNFIQGKRYVSDFPIIETAFPIGDTGKIIAKRVKFGIGPFFYDWHGGDVSIEITGNVININQLYPPNYSSQQINLLNSGIRIEYEFKSFLPPPSGDVSTYLYDNTREIDGFYIDLYEMACEKNVVEKVVGTDIIYVDFVYGTLKEDTDVINPSILLKYDTIPNFNYVMIPSFSRSYFVRRIVSVRNGLWRVDLHVDVLNSYFDDIYEQKALITRSESNGDYSLVDKRRPVSDVPTITYTDVTGGTNSNVSFNINNKYFALSVVRNDDDAYWHDEMTPPDVLHSGLPSIFASTYELHNVEGYVLTETQMNYVLDQIKEHSSDLESFVVSLIHYPFDFTLSFFAESGGNKVEYDVQIGKKYMDKHGNIQNTPYTTDGVKGYRLYNGNLMPYFVVADFTISAQYSDEQSYLDYEPYTHYELYINFYGWVQLNAKDVVGKNLWVYYAVNFVDGSATCYVYNYTDKKVLFSAPCQVGNAIPISATNKQELQKQSDSNALNMILGLVGSGVAISTGLGSGNALALVGGVMSASKTIANGINDQMHRFQRGQASSGGSMASCYQPFGVILKTTTNEPLTIDEDAYAHIQGYPCNQYDELSSYSGYTEIGEIHYVPDNYKWITENEIDEIVQLLMNGVVL